MEDSGRNFRWLFTDEELRNTPSVRNGISLEQELTFRQKIAMLIQTIGLKSGLTQLAVNTSVIFMHRFFMYRTVKVFPRVPLALGFAFAGGKVEESARKLEHLIRTAVDVIRSNKNREFLDKSDPLTYEMDNQWRSKMEALCQSNCNTESAAYLEMRKLVLECETEIYAVIGFQLQIVHPHNYVIRMCALLGAENIKDISQYAYNLATASSQLTMLCLKYKPELLATMCLNVASKAHSVRFESMKDSNVKWYQVIVSTTDFADVEAVTEEFLHLIKGCPLLPSWMTNLARMSRVSNSRAAPGPSRGPGASTASAPQGSRQSQSSVSALASSSTPAASGSIPSSSSLSSQHGHPPRSSQSQSAASLALPHGSDAQQSQSSSSGAAVQSEPVISPNNRQSTLDTGSSSGTAHPDSHPRDPAAAPHPPSHSRPHPPGSNSQMRLPQSSSAMPGASHHYHSHHLQQQQPQQQQRPHPSSSGRPSNSSAPGSGSVRPPSKSSATTGSSHTSGSRSSSQHPAQPGSHPSSHPSSSRPPQESSRSHHDPNKLNDQSRSHQDALRYDHSRSREPSRSQDPSRHHDASRPSHDSARSQDSSRHNHPQSDRRPDVPVESRHAQSHLAPRDEPIASRQPVSQSVTEQFVPQRPSESSPQRPPSPPPIKPPSPPEPAPELSNTLLASGDAPDFGSNINRTSSSPEGLPRSQMNLDSQKQRSSANQPKLSLSMYRERASARSRNPTDPGTSGEESNTFPSAADELMDVDIKPEQATNSPADKSLKASISSSDLANFTKPQDSPNNPRIKIKVKRDPSSGEHHAVKYADTGIKIKIKPIRSDNDGEAGPSGASSRSSTPREEGEIVDDTPPSSASSSERKSEGLRIRLPVPKVDNGSGYSRRDSDQGSNGVSGDRESSSHRSHHHSHHHRSHHSHKSKKHSSKHDRDRSRHEGKSSSKRSASSMEFHDERPSKSSRIDTYSAAGGDVAYHSGGFTDHSSFNTSSRSLQHQNSGFSINDAFSSTMPQNIFDDDDDDMGHTQGPPITPTNDVVPPHHERFHQLMAEHRAKMEAKKPPLPKGPPPSSAPPPPPPPPTL